MLPDFSTGSVLVVGDVMLDRYWQGSTERISPEAPVPVVHIRKREERPGGAGNVALNTRTLGMKTHLLALTGLDEESKILQKQLETTEISCYLEGVTDHPTITKLRIISHHQQLIRLDFEEAFTPVQVKTLLPLYEAILNTCNLVILSDYGKGIGVIASQLITIAKKKGKPILVDPKGLNFERYRGATLVTPNLAEFEAIVGPCSQETDLVEKGQKLITEYDLNGLLITRGERGMTLVQRNQSPQHFSTEAKEVFDVTGAGDTVIAVLGASLAAGASLIDAIQWANKAAGIVVGRLGAASVTPAELRQTRCKIISEVQLQTLISTAKIQGKKIVMTNGCFDLLHPGHTVYLEQAKMLGDYLLVAVNSDVSVRLLKGQMRPINSLQDRMALLASLGCVDWVVSFEEETPLRLIELLRPDVLAKGGDYQTTQVAGNDTVTAYGGKMVILPYQPGYSSSAVIEKIRS